MTDQDREEIKIMIERALTARFGNVAYATTAGNPVYPANAWFTINPTTSAIGRDATCEQLRQEKI